MFRRLEAFALQDVTDYIDKNNKDITTYPDMFLSGLTKDPSKDPPGKLPGFDESVQTSEINIPGYQTNFNPFPNYIFKNNPTKDTTSQLYKLIDDCSKNNINTLINSQNKNPIRCGWLYSPGGISKGYPGKSSGPLQEIGTVPDHKKWFFDLQLAKKQILLDKCSSLTCNTLDSLTPIPGDDTRCGYCPNSRRVIPVDASGNPKYNSKWNETCYYTPITDKTQCPGTTGTATTGLRRQNSYICTPNGGKLSSTCLRTVLINNGCNRNGSLAMALNNPKPGNYIMDVADNIIYNRTTDNLNNFKQGNATINAVLSDIQKLRTTMKGTGEINAAARDLCLRKGEWSDYSPCSEITDETKTHTVDITCLQNIFLVLGGTPNGTLYPSDKNRRTYDTYRKIKDVKKYLNDIITIMRTSTNYTAQREAVAQIYGIR